MKTQLECFHCEILNPRQDILKFYNVTQGSTHHSVRVGAYHYFHRRTNWHRVVLGSLTWTYDLIRGTRYTV